MDDVVSCMEGNENEEKTLERMNEFAIKHKLKWGEDKCKILRVGKHRDKPHDWKMGDMTIKEATEYKYLGDVVTNDGKNIKNIESRGNKLQATTISINTIAASEVLNRVETSVLLELHEKISMTGYLNNGETWILNKNEIQQLEKNEIQSMKNLFDLPLHTPNPAIIFTFGTLCTKQRIDQKQLTYLYKILNRGSNNWTKKTLTILESMNIGWYKNIQDILIEYKLPTDFTAIKNMSHNDWKNKVQNAIESKNKERLHKECHETKNNITKVKTKTESIIKQLADTKYKREPRPEILQMTKHETKTIVTARYRMLQCGKNFKGTMKEICDTCNTIDDENHRLNDCIKWRTINLYDSAEKTDFYSIYSDNVDVLRHLITKIERVWNTQNAHGTMNEI